MIEVLDAWLRLSAERLHEQSRFLTTLDQAIGDGDHGINMDRGFTAIVGVLDAATAATDGAATAAPAAAGHPAAAATAAAGPPAAAGPATGADRAAMLLRTAGRTLISTVGGAAGPLYGTAFPRAAAALPGAGDSSAAAVVAALEAAATGIAGLGKASTGEKTMLDAIVPAATAARAALEAGADAAEVASAAAEAAEAGVLATVPMVATKGRASYLGERSAGHQDPGATSAALLIRALADATS